jgi:CDP-diacylglycerol--serine O-phosphatidyltransferase
MTAPKKKIRELSIRALIPNRVTTLSLCLGLWAIRLGFDGQYAMAVTAIIGATFLDGIDGSLARLLKSTSKMGGELDSLADFLSFGVAPVLVLYAWAFDGSHSIGWIAVLAYTICMSMRLARFNVIMLDENNDVPIWKKGFFVGVPAPAGAGLVMFPFYLDLGQIVNLQTYPVLLALYIGAVAFLMVSTIPTFSLKKLKVPKKYMLISLVLVALVAAFLQSSPWLTLTALTLAYLTSIPISIIRFRKTQKLNAISE